MADNFPQTAGSGRNVATDQVTYSGDTADVQLVRVVNTTGAEGSRVVTDKPVFQTEDLAHVDGDLGMLMLGVRNHITGSTTDGDYSAISVSSTGEMQTLARRDLVRLQQAISFTGNPPAAYVTGDQFGNLVTLTNAARISGGTGTITGVTINSASVLIGTFDVLFFESSVTLAGDSSPFSISDADGLKLIGIVPMAGAYSLGLNRVSQAFNLAVPYVCVGSTSLFAAIITRSAFTLAAGDFTSNLNVFVERN